MPGNVMGVEMGGRVGCRRCGGGEVAENKIKSLPLGGFWKWERDNKQDKQVNYHAVRREEHTAGAQLASTINRMSPLTHSINIPDLGLVCGLRICIIMVEAPSLPGSPGAVAARRDGRILWLLGSKGQSWSREEGPRWRSSCGASALRGSLERAVVCALPPGRGTW